MLIRKRSTTQLVRSTPNLESFFDHSYRFNDKKDGNDQVVSMNACFTRGVFYDNDVTGRHQ